MTPGLTYPAHHSDAAQPTAGRAWTDTVTLVLAMAGAFCCPMSWSVFAGYLSISDAFFLAALASQARSGLRTLGELGGVPWLLIICGVLFAFSGLISFASDDAHAEPINAAKLIFSMTVFPVLLLLTVGTDLRRLDALLLAWVCGGALSAAVAIASRNGISLLGLYDTTSAIGGRAVGLAYHANVLGYTCALTAPVALYLTLRYTRWIAKAIMLTALLALLYGLYLCGSRASVLALALGGLYPVLSALFGRRLPLVLTAMLGIASAAALTYAALGEFDTLVSDDFRESALGRTLGLSTSAAGSNHERMVYIDYVWAAFLERPLLGDGYGWLRGAHVHVLAILHSGGMLGFSAFLCWVVAILLACQRVVAALGQASVAAYRPLWLVIVTGLLIWLINGGLQPVLPDRNGYILVAALFSLDAHLRRVRSRAEEQARFSQFRVADAELVR